MELTEASTPGSEALRILLVDDHPYVRKGTRDLITQTYPNSEISEAGNAADALKQLENEDFHLVFLDVKLPECDGAVDKIEVGKRTLKTIRAMDGPPVVIMSRGNRDRALVEGRMNLGAAAFLPRA